MLSDTPRIGPSSSPIARDRRDTAIRVGPYVPAVNRLTGGIRRAAHAIELKDYPMLATTDRPVS